VFYDLEGQALDDAEVTFGVALPAFTQANVDTLFGIYTDNFKSSLDGSAAISRLQATDSTLVTIVSSTGAVGGTATGGAAVPQAAYLVRKIAAVGGRANTGRMYLPGVSESKVDGAGTVDSTFRNGRQTEMNTFLDDLGAADIGFVILHANGSTPTDVTALLFEGKIATQRRRLKR